MSFPASLLHHLHATVPGFTDERPRDQQALAQMLWDCANGRREHLLWTDMFSFSMPEIRAIWRDDARMRMVVSHRYFTVYQGSNLTEATSGYAPSIYMAEALVRTLNNPDPEDWVGAAAKRPASTTKAIDSMAARGKEGKGNRQSKWKGADPAKLIPVNTVALEDYRREVVAAWKGRRVVLRATQWARRQARYVGAAIKMAQSPQHTGAHVIRYREGSTGRITPEGHSLQSMPQFVRSAALSGAWDYDISTCQWTILAQMAARLDVACPLVDAYIADKKSLRQRVSQGAGISPSDAKKSITALLFGAIVQTSEKAMWVYQGDLVKNLGMRAAMRLSVQPDFMEMYAEVDRVGRAVVELHPRSNGRLFNALRIECDPEVQVRKKLAHLLQGAEAAALRAVVSQQQENILLCVHDGWVSKERLDVAALSAVIRAETGYQLGIEEARLSAPTRDQIKDKLDEFEAFSEGEVAFEDPFSVAKEMTGVLPCLPCPPARLGPLPALCGARFMPSDEARLWTLHPEPSIPVMDRLAFRTPRPPWNLAPGSTAQFTDNKPRGASD